jgi:hypothetical protein
MRLRLACLAALFALLGAALSPPAAHAQQTDGQQRPATDRTENLPGNLPAFAPLDLPTPNAYRSASGRPGPQYWQNAADYEIDVTLDPEAERLDGTVRISYTNNAPEALDRLWVQLDQNLFKEGSRGAALTGEEDRFSGAFGEGGYDITNVRIEHGGQSYEPEYLIDGTIMRVSLDEALGAEDGSLSLSMDFAFQIPEYGADRMGQFDAAAGTVFQLAQWYPRMFVFDDVNGWNVMPYLGQGEYYLEYGTFDVNVTVPREMIVAATGTLENPGEVLTAEQRQRLDEARTSDDPVTIIGRGERGEAGTRPDGSGPLTWQFHAEEVRDFSWAASESFIWDAARAETGDGNPALVQSFYPEEGIGSGPAKGRNAGWEHSTEYVQHSIEHYSERWDAPYPYPTATNVAGIVAGMEYPMIAFCSVESRGPSLFGVTDHEFGHEWFPMVVGSDERRHAWMDEGINTFMNQYSTLAYYDQSPAQVRQSFRAAVREGAIDRAADRPILTYSDRIPYDQLGFLAYNKPAAGLFLLREYVLGAERFDAAFRSYYDRWAYRHPQPADFFRTIEDVTGEDLDWFWRGWFFSNDRIDQALTNVSTSGDTTRVQVAQQAGLPMPVELRIERDDGSAATRRLPVEAFFSEDTYTAVVPGDAERVVIDPRGYLPDVDMDDNAWSDGAGIRAPGGSQ